MLASHYFSKTDSEAWGHTVEVFERHKFELAAVRSHCKIIAVKIGKDHYIAAGSGNLRSCRASENMDLNNSPSLYKFYADYVRQMLAGGKA